MNANFKTRTVTFTYGTCKDAALKIPAQPASLNDVIELIRISFIEYMFSRPALISDEVFINSIGRSNFFAGALGGWQTRLDAKSFDLLKSLAEDNVALAIKVIQFRNPSLNRKDACRVALKNEALDETDKEMLNFIIALPE